MGLEGDGLKGPVQECPEQGTKRWSNLTGKVSKETLGVLSRVKGERKVTISSTGDISAPLGRAFRGLRPIPGDPSNSRDTTLGTNLGRKEIDLSPTSPLRAEPSITGTGRGSAVSGDLGNICHCKNVIPQPLPPSPSHDSRTFWERNIPHGKRRLQNISWTAGGAEVGKGLLSFSCSPGVWESLSGR